MVQELSARMLEDDLCASACQVTRVTPTLGVFKGSVMRTLTVDPSVHARTTSVWTHAACHVDRVLTVLSRTTWPYAGVPEAPQGTLSGTAGDLPGMRFVLLVGPILTVRLDKMTVLFVAVSRHILEILCRGVAMSATLTMSVDSLKHVIVRTIAVSLPVGVEHVEKMPTARLSTTVHSAHVLQTSLEILSHVVTQSAHDTMTVPLTRLVSS